MKQKLGDTLGGKLRITQLLLVKNRILARKCGEVGADGHNREDNPEAIDGLPGPFQPARHATK